MFCFCFLLLSLNSPSAVVVETDTLDLTDVFLEQTLHIIFVQIGVEIFHEHTALRLQLETTRSTDPIPSATGVETVPTPLSICGLRLHNWKRLDEITRNRRNRSKIR